MFDLQYPKLNWLKSVPSRGIYPSRGSKRDPRALIIQSQLWKLQADGVGALTSHLEGDNMNQVVPEALRAKPVWMLTLVGDPHF